MILELAFLLTQQAATDEPWFTLHQDTRENRAFVSADRRTAAAETALRKLASRMNWRIVVDSKHAIRKLEPVTLDLMFARQAPRTVAQLIAVTAGVGVVFDETGHRVVMRVVDVPAGKGAKARKDLRRHAILAYRMFLDDRTVEPSTRASEKKIEGMMRLGRLLEAEGELETAISLYGRVFEEDESRVHAPLALLRMGHAHLELAGSGSRPKGSEGSPGSSTRNVHLLSAESSARRLIRMKPKAALRAKAAVLLGRAVVAAGRHGDCAQVLEPERKTAGAAQDVVDIHLLLAGSYAKSAQPRRAIEVLDGIESRIPMDEWSRRQLREYHYTRGQSAGVLSRAPTGESARSELLLDAARSMESFLGGVGAEETGVSDERRGKAFVLLGRAYLETGNYVQARAAIARLLAGKRRLDLATLEETYVLEARTGMAMGRRDQALDRLEILAKSQPEKLPKMVLFLVDNLIESDQHARAIRVADLLVENAGPWCDEARHRRILAMFERAKEERSMADFPAAAIEIARRIESGKIQSRVAEIIGDAYESLGMIDRAVEAYRGILR